MAQTSLLGEDMFQFGSTIFSSLADGVWGKLTIDEAVAKVTMGKDGNAIIAPNAMGLTGKIELRIMAGKKDDKVLNRELTMYLNDKTGYSLQNAVITKVVGDGTGKKTYITYSGSGGFCEKIPDMQASVAGEAEQGVAVWEIRLLNISRAVA